MKKIDFIKILELNGFVKINRIRYQHVYNNKLVVLFGGDGDTLEISNSNDFICTRLSEIENIQIDNNTNDSSTRIHLDCKRQNYFSIKGKWSKNSF